MFTRRGAVGAHPIEVIESCSQCGRPVDRRRDVESNDNGKEDLGRPLGKSSSPVNDVRLVVAQHGEGEH